LISLPHSRRCPLRHNHSLPRKREDRADVARRDHGRKLLHQVHPSRSR
jgi:hypothetical protein